jgi:D-hydroxyproline dehydrogenase subunit gamma
MSAVRLSQFQRGEPFGLTVNGHTVTAYSGESLATVLLAAGVRTFQKSLDGKNRNRVYCGMGECMQCLVTVDGIPSCQACKTLARPGMRVETQL